MDEKLSRKFQARVKKGDGCWLWIGGCDKAGYGQLMVDGRTFRAPRLSWEFHYGSIPVGLWVCHRCDNPPCVRPDHLFLGTARDNAQDRETKGRGNRPRGERHGCAKLTLAQVTEIRTLYAQGNVTQRELGIQFGISTAQMWRILNGKRWANPGQMDSQPID